MLEQAPSASATVSTEPSRNPAAKRSRARNTEVNPEIPDQYAKSAAFYPSAMQVSSSVGTVRCRKPGGSVTAGLFARCCSNLEHDPRKWTSASRKDHAQTEASWLAGAGTPGSRVGHRHRPAAPGSPPASEQHAGVAARVLKCAVLAWSSLRLQPRAADRPCGSSPRQPAVRTSHASS